MPERPRRLAQFATIRLGLSRVARLSPRLPLRLLADKFSELRLAGLEALRLHLAIERGFWLEDARLSPESLVRVGVVLAQQLLIEIEFRALQLVLFRGLGQVREGLLGQV